MSESAGLPGASPPPGPGPAGRGSGAPVDRLLALAGILVAVVLLGGLAALVVLRPSGPASGTLVAGASALTAGTASPASSPAASVTAAASPSLPASPAPSLSEEQLIASVERQVVPIRQLEPTGPVPNRFVTPAQLTDLVRADFDATNPPAQLRAAQALLERLGLLPAATDLRSLQVDALSSQVLGFYDNRTRQMTIVQRTAGFGPLEEITLAHEYTHALQDQRFGLEKLGLGTADQTDRSLARLALVEGDASLSMTQWALQQMTPAELGQVATEASDPIAQDVVNRLPPLLRRQLLFPYVDGVVFVSRLYASGGWAAVDAAYGRPPDSTAQILHPDVYLARDEPVTVAPPFDAARLGPGWQQSAADTLGELTIQVWLGSTAAGGGAQQDATGWAGDRVASYDGPDGSWVVAWVTRWDTPAVAARFAASASAVAATLPHADVVPGPGPEGVTVVAGSDASTLGRAASLLP